jgi:hypothetical protein
MTEIERLVAIEEIKQLKARYFRTLDSKDWDGYQAVYAPDAVLDCRHAMYARNPQTGEAVRNGRVIPESEAVVESRLTHGAAAIRAEVEESVRGITTVHHGHMAEIEILSPTTARGIWAMEDLLRGPPGWYLTALHGYGHYHETYERIDGRWHIKSLKLTRLRLDAEGREV